MYKMVMKITSKDFIHEGNIPQIFTCEGKYLKPDLKRDVSPELSWSDLPLEAKSLVMIMHDPDAPYPGGWDHWVLFNIPVSAKGLPQDVAELPKGTEVGLNSWKRNDYGGPCPPTGSHRYYFKLYALDVELQLATGASKEQVLDAMKGHVKAEAELMGRYEKVKKAN
jgi:Raf kinase inhibitor-like YbhB/YbcL family protein